MSAIISECGLYRHRLERQVELHPLIAIAEAYPGENKTVAFFGVNPSTADANLDDATIRKMVGFARRWGFSRIIVGNVFPYRATDVRELAKCESAIGDFTTYIGHLKAIAQDADLLVPCWGNSSKVPKELRCRFRGLLRALRTTNKPICHLGLTNSGDPKHPLMLGYDTPLTPWNDPQ